VLLPKEDDKKKVFIVARDNIILEPHKHNRIPITFTENLPTSTRDKEFSYLIYPCEEIQKITKNRSPILTTPHSLTTAGLPIFNKFDTAVTIGKGDKIAELSTKRGLRHQK